MYRDLWSTKGRKYGQRQSELNTMWRKGIIPSAALGICWPVFAVSMSNHVKPSSVSTTDTTDKPQVPVLFLWPWGPQPPARHVLSAQPCAACWQHWFAGRRADGKMLPSPFWCPVTWVQQCLPSAKSHSSPNPGELLPAGLAPSFSPDI